MKKNFHNYFIELECFCGSHAEPGTVPDSKDAKVGRKTQALSSQCSQAAQHQETAGIAQAPAMSNPGAALIRSLGCGFSAQMLKERLLARTNKEDVPPSQCPRRQMGPQGFPLCHRTHPDAFHGLVNFGMPGFRFHVCSQR